MSASFTAFGSLATVEKVAFTPMRFSSVGMANVGEHSLYLPLFWVSVGPPVQVLGRPNWGRSLGCLAWATPRTRSLGR